MEMGRRYGKKMPNGQYMLKVSDLEKILNADTVNIGTYAIFVRYKKVSRKSTKK